MVATRATCARKHVGAVIVRDKTILSTGYNGSLPNEEHCDDVGHLMIDGHCKRTIHAEQNAIFQAAKNGIRLEDSKLYCTTEPCFDCLKAIYSVGIRDILFSEFYGEPDLQIISLFNTYKKVRNV